MADGFQTFRPDGAVRHSFKLDDVLRMQDLGILDPDTSRELIDGEIIEMPSAVSFT